MHVHQAGLSKANQGCAGGIFDSLDVKHQTCCTYRTRGATPKAPEGGREVRGKNEGVMELMIRPVVLELWLSDRRTSGRSGRSGRSGHRCNADDLRCNDNNGD